MRTAAGDGTGYLAGGNYELETLAAGGHPPAAGPGPLSKLSVRTVGASVSLIEARSARLRAAGSGPFDGSGRDDVLMLCMHLAGSGTVTQHGRDARLAPGDGVLYEARGPWQLVFPGEIHSLTLQFYREQLPLPDRDITASCARPADAVSPAVRLLAGYVTGLRDLAEALPAQQRDDAARGALDLVTMVARGLGGSVPPGSGSDAVLLRAIRAYARDNAGDASLDVTALARRHHVSVRRLYLLFEASGTTPGAFLRAERLRAAQAMLSDSRQDFRTVVDVARRAGFAELRTFERAFRQVHGVSPGRWRRERQPGRAEIAG